MSKINENALSADQYYEMPSLNDAFRKQDIEIDEIKQIVDERMSKVENLVLKKLDSLEGNIKTYEFKKLSESYGTLPAESKG